MKILFSILFMFVYLVNHAQYKVPLKDTSIILGNGIIQLTAKGINITKSDACTSNMPNALIGYQQNLSNSQKANELFNSSQSSVDNMIVLQPNAQNLGSLNMPTMRCTPTNSSFSYTTETPYKFKSIKPAKKTRVLKKIELWLQ